MCGRQPAILERFLLDEFQIEEARQNILYFMLNEHICSGEYEGNQFVLKKLDAFHFVLYQEDIYPNDLRREISGCTAFTRRELLFPMARAAGKSVAELVEDAGFRVDAVRGLFS